MKKIELGQTVAIFANIGVIAGIVLLAVELDQNNELLRNQARYNLHLARSAEIDDSWRNPELTELLAKARRGDVTELEAVRFQQYLMSRWVRWEWYYEQYRDGLIDEPNLPIVAWRRFMSQSPVYAEVWKQNSEVLSPDFVRYMEENVFSR